MSQGFSDETIVTSIGALEGSSEREPAVDILGGPSMGQQIILSEGETLWGRSRDADVVVEDEAISRYHFKITVVDRIATLEDLNSTNGTFVNGERIRQHILQPNDKIQISSVTVLRFSYVDPIDTDVHKRIYEMAHFDPVTQAHTKRYFMDRIQHEFSHSQRRNTPLSLVIFDLDHFKKINDGYGHPAGDYVLQRVAEMTRKLIRREDIFARYGGEEFVILMRDTSELHALAFAERIRVSIERGPFVFEGVPIEVTLSAGVACYHDQCFSDSSQLIRAADQCLYRSKAEGRNRVTSLQDLA